MQPLPIQVRTLHATPGPDTPRHWHSAGAFETHFFNALSSTFPEGERFFISAVRNYAHRVGGDLRAEVDAFTRQEGQHSRAHDSHMDLLEAQGYGALSRVNRVVRRIGRAAVRKVPRWSLALTAGIEHITAVFAHHLLSDPERWLGPMHPDMRPLWHWHAVEETEHKAVAFDVFASTGGGPVMRRLAMGQAVFGFLAEVFFRHLYLLHRDGLLLNGAEWRRGWRYLWGKGGLLRLILPDLGTYLRPGFHPWQQDDRALVADALSAYGAGIQTSN